MEFVLEQQAKTRLENAVKFLLRCEDTVLSAFFFKKTPIILSKLPSLQFHWSFALILPSQFVMFSGQMAQKIKLTNSVECAVGKF